ncbi:50S ribosomal protein L29,Ribosomal protein L29,ribosomal protein L29,Ribosomal L29 protein [Chlamydia serpentis]|uniref:Large ribosomal subunit protein uL29 n=1 Tax=Chlamydia serpentis TaxID=1967782 RepID=A0A2R8FBF3_9CHLA|nr:50S ribosomal protein L29 [Chlamydia serpentis]SPN73759.1 50S ribosomal protein L29,Ribosomal protein L29,ribosomal protein L29,Ribosomal L29 protein [Chlamydia serpentis]
MAVKKDLLKQLRAKNDDDLDLYIHENKKALFALRAESLLQNKVVKVHMFSMHKKNIARALTVKQERKGKVHG